jgi:hypothetical protein
MRCPGRLLLRILRSLRARRRSAHPPDRHSHCNRSARPRHPMRPPEPTRPTGIWSRSARRHRPCPSPPIAEVPMRRTAEPSNAIIHGFIGSLLLSPPALVQSGNLRAKSSAPLRGRGSCWLRSGDFVKAQHCLRITPMIRHSNLSLCRVSAARGSEHCGASTLVAFPICGTLAQSVSAESRTFSGLGVGRSMASLVGRRGRRPPNSVDGTPSTSGVFVHNTL